MIETFEIIILLTTKIVNVRMSNVFRKRENAENENAKNE